MSRLHLKASVIFTVLIWGYILMPSIISANEIAENVDVLISNRPHGAHSIDGQFTVVASSKTVWDILTDYNHMASFVSSVKSSQVVSTESNNEVVEQVMTGQAGIFRKRIYLRLMVAEIPFQKISFEDVSKQSFKSYAGSWEIKNQSGEIKVIYQLEATPAFFSPNFIADGAFKKSVTLLLKEVRNEILRRNKNGERESTSSR